MANGEHDGNQGGGPADDPGDEQRGTVDGVSVIYVLAGIPAMIVFFVLLFGAVGACDEVGIRLPF